jgi:NTE family protein
LSTVATDLISGQPFIFSEGSLASGVRASISVPTIFAPVKTRHAVLIDGGVSSPVPDDVVKHMGADIVISVNLDNWIKNEPFPKKYHERLPNIAARSLNILRYNLARRSMTCSDIIIEPYTPAVGLTGIADFLTKNTASALVQSGAKEMDKALEKLTSLL